MKSDIIIVIPVYNDWESLHQLLTEIEKSIGEGFTRQYIIVNDSSETEPALSDFPIINSPVILLEANRNIGHQKAIAAGLAYANDNCEIDYCVVMDSDGEDKPDDINTLINTSKNVNGVVFARRSKRSEGLLFRLFYGIYKIIFFLLTGKQISFGNFCIIPQKYLSKIVYVPDIWNHFSGGIIRSGIPYTSVSTKRGIRYFGKSKMNFVKLILHGLSAVSVYADFMAVRLILLSFFLIIFTLIGIFIVAFIRLFTHLAIPGWATFTVLGLGIILFLAFLLGLLLLFNVLSMKTHKPVIPAKDYKDYIIEVTTLFPDEPIHR